MKVDVVWIAVAVLAVLCVGLVLLQLRARQTLAALDRRQAELLVRLEQLRGEVQAATTIGVRAGERLRKMEQATAQYGERLGKLELRGEGRPYDQAISLVQHGADVDRLVENLGLSRGEAELVTLLHGKRRQPGG